MLRVVDTISDSRDVDMTAEGTGVVSTRLLEAWTSGLGSHVAAGLARAMPVPGSVALRGRFHLLCDGSHVVAEPGAFEIDEGTWQRQVRLTGEADVALVENDLVRARATLTELRESVPADQFPLPIVDSLVGLGDAARRRWPRWRCVLLV
jgi:hypothetical protein